MAEIGREAGGIVDPHAHFLGRGFRLEVYRKSFCAASGW
jgi:hypothetical protein